MWAGYLLYLITGCFMKYLGKALIFIFIPHSGRKASLCEKIFIPHIKGMMQLAVTDTQTHIRTYVYDRALSYTKSRKKDRSIFRCLRKTVISGSQRRHVILSMRLCLCPFAWNSAPTGRILMKFDMWVSFGNLLGKFKFN